MIGKNIAKFTATGIGIACFINVVLQAAHALTTQNPQNNEIVTNAVATILIGLGYGIPSAIYLCDRFAQWMQVLIAVGTGTLIYVLVAFWAGWIPMEHGIWSALVFLVAALLVALFIGWACGKVFNKSIKEVNQALKARKAGGDISSM